MNVEYDDVVYKGYYHHVRMCETLRLLLIPADRGISPRYRQGQAEGHRHLWSFRSTGNAIMTRKYGVIRGI